MSSSSDRIARIERLRELFLDDERGERALPDYWRNEHDLVAYDSVLGARIGWKWDAALDECSERGFGRADDEVVLDFGCGSGIAARRFVARFGARQVLCHDRSRTAMQFAVRALESEAPTVAARTLGKLGDVRPDVLLVSHVLGEIDAAGEQRLQELIQRSQRVVIVEPGNRVNSRKLLALRDSLLDTFELVAPCPHRALCPALAANDWCHFFAPPPPEAFTDGDWVRTTRALGIDSRSVPYSFLALARTAADVAPPPHRVLGRANVGKHAASAEVCESTGLRKHEITKRHHAATWRQLKKHPSSLRTLPAPPSSS